VTSTVENGLTPSERLQFLCDPGSFGPIGPDPPSAPRQPPVGVLGARGRVDGRPVVCYAQDSSVAGGSVGTAEAETVIRVLRIGREERIPLVAFLESGGARLQEGPASLGGFGRIFLENVVLSGLVPQISVITGTAAGGACYSPALTDFVVMTESSSMFLTGPTVVREALGEDITTAALGGSRVHERNGVCHLVASDDRQAIRMTRELLGYLPLRADQVPPFAASEPPATVDPAVTVPTEKRQVYDVRAVIRAIVDGGRILEIAGRWARNLVTVFARVGGQVVGVVANQPHHLGGVIDVDASQKGAWFVRKCDTYGLPLLVLVDTPGFMPGTRQEAAGVIRYGAQLLRAFTEATVPRFTVILRRAYGGAYITMNSKDIGADMALAWQDAELGVMGANAAVRIINRRELAAAAHDPERVVAKFADAYARRHLSAETALRLGMVDEVIEPRVTRHRLLEALTASQGRRSTCVERSRRSRTRLGLLGQR
jgi:acetyl-CoA carboxylase carboxyltransferase component